MECLQEFFPAQAAPFDERCQVDYERFLVGQLVNLKETLDSAHHYEQQRQAELRSEKEDKQLRRQTSRTQRLKLVVTVVKSPSQRRQLAIVAALPAHSKHEGVAWRVIRYFVMSAEASN